jgi:hypothetical protein
MNFSSALRWHVAQVAMRGSSCGQLGVVKRLLPHARWETRRKLARWVHVAKEHIGDGVARFDARAPGLEDRRHMARSPLQFKGRPARTTRITGLPVATMASRSFLLIPGKAEVHAAACLALKPVGRLAQRQNRNIGRLCSQHSFRNGLCIIREQEAPAVRCRTVETHPSSAHWHLRPPADPHPCA